MSTWPLHFNYPQRSNIRNTRGRAALTAAMREVHTNTPSTVTRAKVTGAKKEAMLRAVAYSKARGGR